MGKRKTAEGGHKLVAKAARLVLRIEDLNVDDSYQRGVKRGHKRIISGFDEDALDDVVVGQRDDGTFWIVDGLQRVTALRAMGKKTVHCRVFRSRGPEHEAAVFTKLGRDRTRITPREELRAMLAAGDERAWKVKDAVEGATGLDGRSLGYRLGLNGKGDKLGEAARDVTAAHTLLSIVARWPEHGGAMIRFALRCIGEAWPGDRLGVYADMIEGFSFLYRQHDHVVDEKRLVDRLRRVTPHQILYTAAQAMVTGGRGRGVAMELDKLYKKRGTR